ncbi:uncharacterized protein [Bos taurus]|uniref:uncharacterized protein isoform X2 n=1 Tax=Bos taurus TaxID=9913 RepID=UPI000572CF16|nr:uncharacterized protein LOC100847782 isoform X2 [Bos taurus]
MQLPSVFSLNHCKECLGDRIGELKDLEDSNEEQFVHDLGKTKRAVFTVTNISYDVRGVAMQVPSRVSVLGIQSPHLVQPFWSLSYSQMTASNQG